MNICIRHVGCRWFFNAAQYHIYIPLCEVPTAGKKWDVISEQNLEKNLADDLVLTYLIRKYFMLLNICFYKTVSLQFVFLCPKRVERVRDLGGIVKPRNTPIKWPRSLNKHCRPRSGTGKRGVCSGSTLFTTHPAIFRQIHLLEHHSMTVFILNILTPQFLTIYVCSKI